MNRKGRRKKKIGRGKTKKRESDVQGEEREQEEAGRVTSPVPSTAARRRASTLSSPLSH